MLQLLSFTLGWLDLGYDLVGLVGGTSFAGPIGGLITGPATIRRHRAAGRHGADDRRMDGERSVDHLERYGPGQLTPTVRAQYYYGRGFEATLADAGWTCCAPLARESHRGGTAFFKPLRQVIESINDTFKSQLDLEPHGGHTPAGVRVRVVQRVLALTAVIWHNDRTGQPTKRPLLAYDH